MPATADRASVASYAQFPAELDRDWLGRVCHLSGADLAVIRRRTDPVTQLAVGALPDGTPVIISGGRGGTVRVWRLADGTPVGEPLAGHAGAMDAVAVGALPDGAPVIVSGSGGGPGRGWVCRANRRGSG
jgi:WD40 repeat protein